MIFSAVNPELMSMLTINLALISVVRDAGEKSVGKLKLPGLIEVEQGVNSLRVLAVCVCDVEMLKMA